MNVLDDLVAAAVADAKEREAHVDLDELKRRCLNQPEARDGVAALRGDGAVSVISEVKRASPSKGKIASIPDPGALASQYEAGGASVISCLTQRYKFHGSLEDFAAVRAAVDIPVLRKDFIVTPYQIHEAREQILDKTGSLPEAVCACLGGGSNAIGMFTAFIDDEDVELIGCEAGGEGVSSGRHAASINGGSIGVFQGSRADLLQDEDGQVIESHSISAGLDYPGIGPEHAYLAHKGRETCYAITDKEAMDAFSLLCRTEGIIPAIESAHALAGAIRWGRQKAEQGFDRPPTIIVNLSGRGDKDVQTAIDWFNLGNPIESDGSGTAVKVAK